MTYHIARNSQPLGQLSKEETLARYNSGAILPTDLVWADGMPSWQPASQVFGAPVAPPAGSGFDAPASTPPPPYAPAPFAPAAPASFTMNPSAGAQRPSNSLALAIVSAILAVFSCNLISLVLGIIAIIVAAQVDKKFNAGDIASAQGFALSAKILGWVAVAFLILLLPFVVIGFIRGFSGAMQHGGY